MRTHKVDQVGQVWKGLDEEDRMNSFPITSKQFCINIYSQMDLGTKAFRQTKNDKVNSFSWNMFDLKGQAFGMYKDFIETDSSLFLKLTPVDKIYRVNMKNESLYLAWDLSAATHMISVLTCP